MWRGRRGVEGEEGAERKEGRWVGRAVVMGRRGCGWGARDVDGKEGVWRGRKGCGQGGSGGEEEGTGQA